MVTALCFDTLGAYFVYLETNFSFLVSGVCHGDELPMLFLMTGIFEISKNEKDPNYIFSKQVVKFWADFAKNE